MLAVPHTTNTDGLLVVLVTRSIGLAASWMVKDVWLKPPIGWVTRGVGAVGVNRRAPSGMVQQMADRFDQAATSGESFHLLVPPEGTRSRAEHWKSGFHRIALDAGVSVVPTYLDYRAKRAGCGEAIEMTVDAAADMDAIRAFYDSIKVSEMPRHPEKFGPIRLRDEMG